MGIIPTQKTDGTTTKQIKTYDNKYLQKDRFDLLSKIDPNLAKRAENVVDGLIFRYVEEKESKEINNSL